MKISDFMTEYDAIINEVVYENMVGIHEMMLFMRKATASEKEKFKKLMKAGNKAMALEVIESVLGTDIKKRLLYK